VATTTDSKAEKAQRPCSNDCGRLYRRDFMVLAVGEPSRSVVLEMAEAISDAACVNPGRQTRLHFLPCRDVPSCESHELLLRVWFSLRRPNEHGSAARRCFWRRVGWMPLLGAC
jgi:hypothetical protein